MNEVSHKLNKFINVNNTKKIKKEKLTMALFS